MTDIKPALTKEGWEKLRCGDGDLITHEDGHKTIHGSCCGCNIADLHALAALCLYGQPEGFTWEDVDQLRSMADWYAEQVEPRVVRATPDPLTSTSLRGIALRISALLPPRE